jgi:hypothetical protein
MNTGFTYQSFNSVNPNGGGTLGFRATKGNFEVVLAV